VAIGFLFLRVAAQFFGLPLVVDGRVLTFNIKLYLAYGLLAMSVFCAGTAAASGSRAGVSQGIFTGLIYCALLAAMKLFRFNHMDALHFAGCMLFAILGGVFGDKAFPPPRVVVGKKADNTDEVVYEGDEVPEASAVHA
jgi:hypothetical protein